MRCTDVTYWVKKRGGADAVLTNFAIEQKHAYEKRFYREHYDRILDRRYRTALRKTREVPRGKPLTDEERKEAMEIINEKRRKL